MAPTSGSPFSYYLLHHMSRGCLLLVLIFYLHTGSAVKILSVPQNVNSHVIEHGRLACGLTAEGHEVTMVIASNIKIPAFLEPCKVNTVIYQVEDEVSFMNSEEASQLFLTSSLAGSMTESYKSLSKLGKSLIHHWHRDCEQMMESDDVREHMRVTRYDISLVDNAAVDCQAVLPVAHDIPIVIYGIMSFQWAYRTPSLPSFVPSLMSQFGDKMTFAERFQNTLVMLMTTMAITNNATLFDLYAPSSKVTDVIQVFRDAVLFLVLDDPAVSYPHPMMPNMEYVGDIIPQPAVDLPDDIRMFVEGATHGVIIVSFGSFFDYLPDDIAAKFCQAFIKMEHRFIWKMKRRDVCGSAPTDKLLLLDWLPQNDLLAHGNVKLFISHCGMNSMLESIYHGTSMLCFPISVDQPHNAARIYHKGLGSMMSLKDFTEDELTNKVSEIINSDSIQKNVAKASLLMKDNLVSPAKRASYLINHVVKYGGNHLRTAAFELNDLQFFMVDVFLVLLGLLIMLFIIIILFCCILKCACVKTTRHIFGKKRPPRKNKSE